MLSLFELSGFGPNKWDLVEFLSGQCSINRPWDVERFSVGVTVFTHLYGLRQLLRAMLQSPAALLLRTYIALI